MHHNFIGFDDQVANGQYGSIIKHNAGALALASEEGCRRSIVRRNRLDAHDGIERARQSI
jgi:hypothetical protein